MPGLISVGPDRGAKVLRVALADGGVQIWPDEDYCDAENLAAIANVLGHVGMGPLKHGPRPSTAAERQTLDDVESEGASGLEAVFAHVRARGVSHYQVPLELRPEAGMAAWDEAALRALRNMLAAKDGRMSLDELSAAAQAARFRHLPPGAHPSHFR